MIILDSISRVPSAYYQLLIICSIWYFIILGFAIFNLLLLSKNRNVMIFESNQMITLLGGLNLNLCPFFSNYNQFIWQDNSFFILII